MIEITKEQFADWKGNYVTRAVMEQIDIKKATLSAILCDGGSVADSADETAIKTARLVGNIEGLSQLLDIEFLDGDNDE